MSSSFRPLAGAAALACALLPPLAHADTVELATRVPRAEGSGWIIPCVAVALEGDTHPGATLYRNRDGYHPELRTTVLAGDDLALDLDVEGTGLALVAVSLVGDEGEDVLWHEGDPSATLDLAGRLDPEAPFVLGLTWADGTRLHVSVELAVSGGWLDPGSLVGFNPQPDPPAYDGGLHLGLGLRADGAEARVTATMGFSSVGERPEALRVVREE